VYAQPLSRFINVKLQMHGLRDGKMCHNAVIQLIGGNFINQGQSLAVRLGAIHFCCVRAAKPHTQPLVFHLREFHSCVFDVWKNATLTFSNHFVFYLLRRVRASLLCGLGRSNVEWFTENDKNVDIKVCPLLSLFEFYDTMLKFILTDPRAFSHRRVKLIFFFVFLCWFISE
jgi:hypothetical protein